MTPNISEYSTKDYERALNLLSGICEITDETVLFSICANAHFPMLQEKAVLGIKDISLLKKITRLGKACEMQALAFEKLGQPQLAAAERVKAAGVFDEKSKASALSLLSLIKETKPLVDIANHAKSEEIAAAAAWRITDKAALEKLAQNGRYSAVRAVAFDLLDQTQKALVQRATGTGSYTERIAAIIQLTDMETLCAIIKNDLTQSVRNAAKHRLHFLETGEKYRLNTPGKPFDFTIPPIYDRIGYGYHEGCINVVKDGKQGIIDKDGQVVVPILYDDDKDLNFFFCEGIAAVCQNGLWGGFDRGGRLVIPFSYPWQFRFSEGLAAVGKDGKFGFIDKVGNTVLPFIYDGASPFESDVAKVCQGEDEFFIDRFGERSEPPFVRDIRIFASDGEERKFGVLHRSGSVLVPPIYDEIIFDEGTGLLMLRQQDLVGACTCEGKIIVPVKHNYLWFLETCDWILARKKLPVDEDNYYGFAYGCYDYDGNFTIPFEYDDMYAFEDGFAPASKDGEWGVINARDSVVVPFYYDDMFPIDKGLILVELDDKFGFINTSGEVIIPIVYDELKSFDGDDFTFAKLNGKWGMIDRGGNTLLPFLFDGVLANMGDFAIVEKDDEIVIVDSLGQVAYPYPLGEFSINKEEGCHWLCAGGKWGMWRQ